MSTISSFMTPDPTTVRGHVPLADCATRMATERIRHLPVVDGERKLTGMLRDADVFGRGTMISSTLWVPHDERDGWLRAGDVSEKEVLTCSADTPTETALRDLAAAFADVIVIVDDQGRPEGILTEHDVVRIGAVLLDPSLPAPGPQRTLPTVQRDRNALEAREIMLELGSRHILVLHTERLHGVLSFRDVAVDVEIDAGTEVEDLLHGQTPRTLPVGAHLVQAAQMMTRHKIGCVPIVDAGGVPQQVVTRTDILAAMVEALHKADADT